MSKRAFSLGLARALLSCSAGVCGSTFALAAEASEPAQSPGKPPARIEDALILDMTHVQDAGNVRVLVTNWGVVGSKPTSGYVYSGAPSAIWPAASSTEYLWAGGIWIGAMRGGEPHVTTAEYEEEFRPGRRDLDCIYVTHEGIPGGARRPSPDADDDHDGKEDEDWLDGRDNDGDGRIDEDFAAISRQMFFCEYRDTDPNIRLVLPNHTPLEVLVQQSSLVWSQPQLDDFVGFDLRIVNLGLDPLEQVYVGFFADCDIGLRSGAGYHEDDRAGFWEGFQEARIGYETRTVKVSLGYMFDTDGDNGVSEGYIGFVFLGAQDSNEQDLPGRSVPLHNFRMFSSQAAFDQGGDPTNDAQRYQVLDGTAPRSLPAPDPQTGLRPPGLASQDGDYRIVVSIGPFEILEPGDTLSVQMAMVLGRHFEGMLDNAVSAQLLYDGVWFDCDGDPTTGILGRETPVCGPAHAGDVLRLDACDSACDSAPTSDPGCFGQVPSNGCVWVNADCALERLTGWITGVDGKERVIHWTTEATVPIAVQDLEAVAGADGVHLTWRLSRQTVDEVQAVRVLRAEDSNGPYTSITATGLEPAAIMFLQDARVEVQRTYWYRIVLDTASGREIVAATIHVVTAGAGAAATGLAAPVQREGDGVQIAYSIGEPGRVDLAIFNALGRRVRTLYHGWRASGSYVFSWDRRTDRGTRLARGVYLVRLDAAGQRAVRKLVLARD